MPSEPARHPAGQVTAAQALTDLAEAQFRKVVEAEVHGDVPDEIARLLRTPDLAGHWRDVLVTLMQDVDAQLSAREADFKSLPRLSDDEYWHELKAYKGWRAGALHFRLKVLERMREAKRVPVGPNWSQVARDLAKAVVHHRRTSEESGLDPEVHDKELWAFVDEVAVRFDWWMEGWR